jgi:hypothetical protein
LLNYLSFWNQKLKLKTRSCRYGINGLPNAGKTTISNALKGDLQEFSPQKRVKFQPD